MSPELLDDLDEFVGFVALAAGEVEELSGLFDDGAVFGGAGDGDAAAAAELEQAFVAELAEGAEDGVGVDAEDGGEVFGGREAFAGFGFAVCDRAADFAGDLFVELEGSSRSTLTPSMMLVIVASSMGGCHRVTAPPRPPESSPPAPVPIERASCKREQALIEEARRRARRRRRRNGAVVLLVAGVGVAAFMGFGGHGGGGAGANAAFADGSSAEGRSQPPTPAPSLAALPADARPWGFAFEAGSPDTVYVTSAHAGRATHIYKTIDGGRQWQPTGARGAKWQSDVLALTTDPAEFWNSVCGDRYRRLPGSLLMAEIAGARSKLVCSLDPETSFATH